MITIVSDTHSSAGHDLEGEALEAVRSADAVVHAGDFNTEAALEAFQELCPVFYAVYGNTDDAAVRERLPSDRVVDHDGVRLAVTHGHRRSETELSLFGRSNDADVVVFGHSHQPTLIETDGCLLLNPGSHTQPRGHRPGVAVLERAGDAIEATIREPGGTLVASTTI